MSESPRPNLSDAEVAAWCRDGLIVPRWRIPDDMLARMRGAVDRVLEKPTSTGIEYTPKDRQGRYYGDFFLWRHDPEVASFLCDSPLPQLAAEIMGVDRQTVRSMHHKALVNLRTHFRRDETEIGG